MQQQIEFSSKKQEKVFERITKKFALNNSYFKNRLRTQPATPYEVWQYYKQHKELPYKSASEQNLIYNCFVEYQKRQRVEADQFFTPPVVAKQLAGLVDSIATTNNNLRQEPILDLCCGYGQLTYGMQEYQIVFLNDIELKFVGVENDPLLLEMYAEFTGCEAIKADFRDYTTTHDTIIANPPFSELQDFMEHLYSLLKNKHSTAFVILPVGYMNKERPKKLYEILLKYRVAAKIKCKEPFARTATHTEIYALEKY